MENLRRLCSASLRQDWPVYLVVTGVFGLGILLGSVGVNSLPADQVHELHRYMQSFLSRAAEMEVDQVMLARQALNDNLLAGLIIYILGMTIICLPLVLAFIFIRGSVLGFTMGFLAAERELQGWFVILLSLLPHNAIYIPALIIGGTASMSFSILMLKRFYNSRVRVWPGFVGYTMIMAFVTFLLLIAALVEAYITPELIRFSASFLAGW
ncbi:MAG: stage II sporulation protein M [Firmicutes bacterium]|nr:stage II sporulation protein M [Bacillota bacterium]